MILVAAVVTIFVAYLCLLTVTFLGGTIVWVWFVISVLILIGMGIYTLVYARKHYEKADPTQRYLDYAAYVMFGLCGFMFCVITFCYNSLKLCIAIFKTTA